MIAFYFRAVPVNRSAVSRDAQQGAGCGTPLFALRDCHVQPL
jgi:hypothetical protein